MAVRDYRQNPKTLVFCTAYVPSPKIPGTYVPSLEHGTAYLEAEDATSAWIEERYERDPRTWESSSNLFASWQVWADHAGKQPGTLKRFVQQLESRGITPERKSHGRGFSGIKLKPYEF